LQVYAAAGELRTAATNASSAYANGTTGELALGVGTSLGDELRPSSNVTGTTIVGVVGVVEATGVEGPDGVCARALSSTVSIVGGGGTRYCSVSDAWRWRNALGGDPRIEVPK